MITIDSHPKANLIYLGALIVSYLSKNKRTSYDLDDTYNYLRSEIDISFELYVYTLDWLYLSGIIDLNEEGEIIYAS